MTSSLLPALIYATGGIVAAVLAVGWQITRYFLDLHRETEAKVEETIAAKNDEIHELRADNRRLRTENRDLKRERDKCRDGRT